MVKMEMAVMEKRPDRFLLSFQLREFGNSIMYEVTGENEMIKTFLKRYKDQFGDGSKLLTEAQYKAFIKEQSKSYKFRKMR